MNALARAVCLAAVLGRSALVSADELDACQFSNVLQLDQGCSAFLIHPQVLVYPAHCGGPFEFASAGLERLAIARCQSYPDGGLFGSDLGFCVLREPARELAIIAPALGCEVAAVTPGRAAWVVGFGATPAQPAGTKHISQGAVQSVNEEITVSGPGFGVCEGDSGGPLVIEIEDGNQRALRVTGILSASSSQECREASAYFTPLWPFIAWIEAQSGFDMSPCGKPDGTWSPSEDCRSYAAALLDPGVCDAEQRPFVSSTCGPAAVQTNTPKRAAISQNTASCQSVSVAHRVRTLGPFGLFCLCFAAAYAFKISARRHRQAPAIDVSSPHEWSSARCSRGRWLRRAGLRAGAGARSSRRHPGRST